ALRCLQPHRLERSVLRGVVPSLRLFATRKLQHHETLWIPIALQRLELPASDDEAAAVFGDGCRYLAAVLLQPSRVVNIDVHDDVSRHERLLSASASTYRISSSARSSSDGGIVRPSALAVVRLIASSNFVGCSIGMSAGFTPLRILST